MRILRVIVTMDPSFGGPCQGIRNSIPEQEKLGITNEVLCFDTPDAQYLGKDGFIIHTIGPAKGPYSYCSSLRPWLAENISRFDAIIIHGLWLYNNYGTYLAWKKYKKRSDNPPKLFVMPHGMLDPYFQQAKARRLKAIRNWIFWKLIERKPVNNATGVFFTCEQELLLARNTFSPYHPRKELNIGYGILAPPSYEEVMRSDFLKLCPQVENKSFILFLSRIHEKKGVDILIKAYIRLKKRIPDLPYLVIAGPGLDTSYGKEMIDLAKDYKEILFPGMLSGNTKWGAFYGCQALALPSHQENFGIAIVEAMACSKAVLITDKVNIWREIQKNNTGLVSNDTENSFYRIMEEWMSLSSDEKINMGNSARQVFIKLFSMSGAAENMIDTIRKA